MDAASRLADERAFQMNSQNLGGRACTVSQLFVIANIARDSLKTVASFFHRRGDRGGQDGGCPISRKRGSDAIKRARVRLHYVVAARAMNVNIHKARNHDFVP